MYTIRQTFKKYDLQRSTLNTSKQRSTLNTYVHMFKVDLAQLLGFFRLV